MVQTQKQLSTQPVSAAICRVGLNWSRFWLNLVALSVPLCIPVAFSLQGLQCKQCFRCVNDPTHVDALSPDANPG